MLGSAITTPKTIMALQRAVAEEMGDLRTTVDLTTTRSLADFDEVILDENGNSTRSPEHDTMSRVARKFHLLRRHDDGTTVFECNDAEGYSQLSVHPDGSRSTYMIKGVCGDCMAGRHAREHCPWRDVQAQDGADHHRDDRVARAPDTVVADAPVDEVVKSQRGVVKSKPLVEPVNPPMRS